MTLKPEEVSWVIGSEIDKYIEKSQCESVGRVIQVGDGIARIWGLDEVKISEVVEFSNGTLGMILNLAVDHVGAVLLGTEQGIKEHDSVKRKYTPLFVPVGEALLGRVVNALGVSVDGKGKVESSHFRPLEAQAPNVVERQPVTESIQTGIKAIDAMIPIGKGQRELIIGDRQTGKTALILDTILNQKDKEVVCIYVAVGQKNSTIAKIAALLEKYDAMKYTTIIAAPASDPAALQYLAPYAGVSMGEYFMYKGKHAICFYDDLTKHAQAYRQIALLLKRPPGREAYPGDIFYLHSRLLERSAKLADELGGGSLTAIPVVETQANDIATYIPTNVISITDGQIYLEADLFHAGIKPAINVGISASRVGGKAQTKAMKKVASSLRLDLAQYRELAAFAQFGAELEEVTLAQLRRGERMVEVLKQDKERPCPLEKQVMILYIGIKGYLDDIPLPSIGKFEEQFCHFVEKEYAYVLASIASTLDLNPPVMKALEEAVTNFKRKYDFTS